MSEHKTIVGLLTAVPNGNTDGTIAYYFEHKEDEFLKVNFESDEQALVVPKNIKIVLCLKEDQTVCTHKQFFKRITS